MKKAIVALTALAFMINFAVPVMATAETATGKTTMTKHTVKYIKTVCPKTGKVLSSKRIYTTKMHQKSTAAMHGKGPYIYGSKYTKTGAKYHKTHRMSSVTMHKRMGTGPTRYYKHMKKRSSGKVCPRMPGQTY